MLMLTDKYLTRLFIKHDNAQRSGAGEGESVSTVGCRLSAAQFDNIYTKLGQLTLYYVHSVFFLEIKID